MKLKYIITGTGRCGTLYVANLLNSVGITCTHEKFYGPFYGAGHDHLIRVAIDISEWLGKPIMAEAAWEAAPHLCKFALEDVPVIHVVRHPMKVINSFHKLFFFSNRGYIYTEYAFRHLPVLAGIKNEVLRAAIWYVFWNRLIENTAKPAGEYIFYKIESRLKLLDLLGIKPPETTKIFDDPKCHTHKGKREGGKITIDDISEPGTKRMLIEIAEKYGYDLGEE